MKERKMKCHKIKGGGGGKNMREEKKANKDAPF
jgi:hypothetical protein